MTNPLGCRTCSICSSPIVAEINEALDKKEPLRVLAGRSGFSRASLSRHNRKCRARVAIAEHKTKKFNPAKQRIILAWPNGMMFVQHDPAAAERRGQSQPTITETELRASDVLLQIEYEAVPTKNPAPLAQIIDEPAQVPDSPVD